MGGPHCPTLMTTAHDWLVPRWLPQGYWYSHNGHELEHPVVEQGASPPRVAGEQLLSPGSADLA